EGCRGTAGKTWRIALSAFNLIKVFDECSASLFHFLATGVAVGTVNITDRDKKTNFPVLTVQLTNARVSSYLLSDGSTSSGPSESIAFVYQRIAITNLVNGSRFCWDTATNTSCP